MCVPQAQKQLTTEVLTFPLQHVLFLDPYEQLPKPRFVYRSPMRGHFNLPRTAGQMY
jgi:hypothetical protein